MPDITLPENENEEVQEGNAPEVEEEVEATVEEVAPPTNSDSTESVA